MITSRNLFRFVLINSLLAIPAARAGTLYSVTDIGLATGILGLNNNGQIVGRNGSSSFLYSGSQLTLPNPSGGTFSASGINNKGQVVGQVVYPSFNYAIGLYSAGTLSVLGLGSNVSGSSINDAGQIAGDLQPYRGMLYSAGVITPIGVLPGDAESTARGINQAGDVLVYSAGTSGHAAIFSNGSLKPVGGSTGLNLQPSAINSTDQVVGSFSTGRTDLVSEAILFSNGQAILLGALAGPGTAVSSAYSINDAGTVVGDTVDSLGYRATVYTLTDGTLDLNSLLVNKGGWALQYANAINNKGEIAGIGILGGIPHGFLLDPVAATPEPTSAALLVLGFAPVAALCFRRRGPAINTPQKTCVPDES